MVFKSIRPFHFRNLEDDPVITESSEVFFIGENGQGKTNLLEALYFLSYASSFRTNSDQLLITEGQSEMSVQASYLDNDGSSHQIGALYQDGKKKVRIDGKMVTDRKELVENLPCIVFTHEDMELVKGSPEQRRRFFNQTACLLSPLAIDELRIYSRILKSRNEAIRQRQLKLLDVLDIQLAEAGLAIQKRRDTMVASFNTSFSEVFRKVSAIDEPLCIDYRPSWKSSVSVTDVLDRLQNERNRDIAMNTSLSGPQRDRFIFKIQNRDFSKLASTGQVRLIALALRISQALYFTAISSRKPVLLVDDVLLELDLKRRKAILELWPVCRQSFFTFLPDEPYQEYAKPDTLLLQVKNGRIYPL